MKPQVHEFNNIKHGVMSTATAILFALLPIVCVAQQESRLSSTASTTACPTWENKKQPSKAEYFQSLRTSSGKPKDQQMAYLDKKEIKTKKQPDQKPEAQRSYIPSFSSGDAIMESKTSVKKEEAKPEDKSEKVEKEESEMKVQSSVSSDRTKKKKKKVKTNCAGTNGVNTSKKNSTKCPAF